MTYEAINFNKKFNYSTINGSRKSSSK